MANVKVDFKQTNKQTNKQTKQTGQKQYAPQILPGGHKKNKEIFTRISACCMNQVIQTIETIQSQ